VGEIDSDAIDMNYCSYILTSGKSIDNCIALVLLTVVQVLGRGLSTGVAKTHSGTAPCISEIYKGKVRFIGKDR